MTGRVLADIIKDDELHANDLATLKIEDDTVVRINQHGDIEVRRPEQWDVIGGLLGDFESRVKKRSGLDWV